MGVETMATPEDGCAQAVARWAAVRLQRELGLRQEVSLG